MNTKSPAGLLLEKGQAKEALEAAKKAFKRNPSPETQDDLVGVYFFRIDQLLKKNDADAARILLENLRGKFPDTRAECDLRLSLLKNGGPSQFDISLFHYVSTKEGTPEHVLNLDRLAREIDDPDLILSSPAIPADHPLKIEAKLVTEAFKAVTKGKGWKKFPEALKAIGRNSPLAHWRRAIHALECFYRNDDEEMRRHLSGIPAHLPVAGLALGLQTFSEKKTISGEPGELGNLFEEVCRGGLRAMVSRILSGKLDFSKKADLKAAEKTIQMVHDQVPEALADVCREFLNLAAANEKRRLFSSAAAILRKLPIHGALLNVWEAKALASWDRPLAARRMIEAVFSFDHPPFSSQERAWLLRKAASLLLSDHYDSLRFPEWEKPFTPQKAPKESRQPATAPLPGKKKRAASKFVGTKVTTIDLLKKSLEFHFFPETFRFLVEELDAFDRPPKEIEALLRQWHELDPQNVEPFLLLAEKTRKAVPLEKTLEFISAGLKIDPFHRQLQNLHAKTLFEGWEIAITAGKSAVANDCCQALDRLLAAGDPVRWYWLSLKWAMSVCSPTVEPMNLCPFGPEVSEDVRKIILFNLRNFTKQPFSHLRSLSLIEDAKIFWKGLGQLCQAWVAVDRNLQLSQINIHKIKPGLAGLDLPNGQILALCHCAEIDYNAQLLFLLTEIGLRRKDHEICRFLFFRGFSWISQNGPRALRIYRTARILAVQVGDHHFAKKAQEMINSLAPLAAGDSFSLFGLAPRPASSKEESLTPQEVQRMVEEESRMTFDKCNPQNLEPERPFGPGRKTARKRILDFLDSEDAFEW